MGPGSVLISGMGTDKFVLQVRWYFTEWFDYKSMFSEFQNFGTIKDRCEGLGCTIVVPVNRGLNCIEKSIN